MTLSSTQFPLSSTVQNTDMSLEKGMKIIISGGIVCSESLEFEARLDGVGYDVEIED